MAARKAKKTRKAATRKRAPPARKKAATASRRKPRTLAERMAASFGERRAREKALATLQREAKARRSKAAKKGAATRRAKHAASLELAAMLAYAAEGGAKLGKWKALRSRWHAAKWDLFDAVGQDRERYLDILDDIADEADTDWQIAYGPEPS